MNNINYLEHEQCDGCPYRDTEIIEEKMYADNKPHIVHTELRCKNYFVCKRIIEEMQRR